MATPEENLARKAAEQQVRMLIVQAVRPLENRLNRAERESRKLKSELNQLKSTVARLKK